MIEHTAAPIYTPGSTQARAHLGALIATALQQTSPIPPPSKTTLHDAYRTYRNTTTLSYAQHAYSKNTLKALSEHIHDDGPNQGARFYDKNFDETPAQGLMQTIPGTFGAQRRADPTELDRRQARLDRDAYDAAKMHHTDTFADPDATTRDKLEATLQLKMAQTRLTELNRHRLT